MHFNDNVHFSIIKPSHPELSAVIIHSIGNPSEDKIDNVLHDYESGNRFLLGCFIDERLVGMVGIEQGADLKYIIKHISILPDNRVQGLGKQLISEIGKHFQVNKLMADTDAESVGFYRAIGFNCQEFVGEHGKRFQCVMTEDNVLLEEYNPKWPKMAIDEIEYLKKLLPHEHILDIQHVGSTAIPGMVAKPIIDIQIAVDSLVAAKEFAINILEANGYVYWYDNPDPERMFFVKGMPPFGEKRTHHVHICEPSCPQWPNKILFRDYLIAHPEKAHQYATLKMELSEQHGYDREKYTDAKKQFVEEILKMARP